MIHKVRVLPSALKHGFGRDDIVYAWCNYEEDSKELANNYCVRLASYARAQAARGGGNRTGRTLTDSKRRMRRAEPPSVCSNYSSVPKDYGRLPQSVHARIGSTRRGAMLEMLAAWDERNREWRVFHAMRPKAGLIGFMGLG